MKKLEFKDNYTPLNAYTFNTMQDNFEKALNKLEIKFKILIVLNIVITLIVIILFIKKH